MRQRTGMGEITHRQDLVRFQAASFRGYYERTKPITTKALAYC